VDGNLRGIERIELKKSAIVVGEIYHRRMADLQGSVLVQKEIPNPQTESVDEPAAARTTKPPHGSAEANSGQQPRYLLLIGICCMCPCLDFPIKQEHVRKSEFTSRVPRTAPSHCGIP